MRNDSPLKRRLDRIYGALTPYWWPARFAWAIRPRADVRVEEHAIDVRAIRWGPSLRIAFASDFHAGPATSAADRGGGRLFPGEHHRATFHVEDTGNRIALEMRSADGQVHVEVAGRPAAELPASSIFRTVAEASAFFEPGSVGYSATTSGRRLDGVVLKTSSWSVAPLAIEQVSSTYFRDETVFPLGTVVFDNALIIRNIAHEWQARAPLDV